MKKVLRFLLVALLLCSSGAVLRADELTVADGTSTLEYAPFYGWYGDVVNTVSVAIYSSDLLEDMGSSATIEKMTFYTYSTSLPGATYEVYLSETESTVVSDALATISSDAVLVYSGTLNLSSNDECVIEFSDTYEYNGGNLLLQTKNITKPDCPKVYWYGLNLNSNIVGYKNGNGNGIAYKSTYLPKVTFEYEATGISCGGIKGLAVSEISSSSAKLSWEAGDGSSWKWLCVSVSEGAVDKEDARWADATEVNTPEVVVSGLNAVTDYVFYVRRVCDSEMGSMKNQGFTTACATASLPFFEDFEGVGNGALPNCWDNSEGTMSDDSYKWLVKSSQGSYYYAYNNGKSLTFNSYAYATNNKTNYAALPPIDMTEAATGELKFLWRNKAGYASDALKVLVSTDGGATRAEVLSLGRSEASDAWGDEIEVDLDAYVGNVVYIYFLGTGNSGNDEAYLWIDNVMVREKPNCIKPTGLTLVSSDVSSLTLSWTKAKEDDADWQLGYRKQGAEDWTIVEELAHNETGTISDLEQNTEYEVMVRTYCGSEEQSEWSNVLVCRTGCGALSELPWSDGMEENDGTLPYCWLAAGDASKVKVTTTTKYAGTYGLTMIGSSDESADAVYAILPEVSADAANLADLQLTLQYRHSYVGDDFEVGAIGYVTELDGSDFESIIELDKKTAWTELKIALRDFEFSDGARLAIKLPVDNENTQNLYIDNVELKKCFAPRNIELSEVTETSARFEFEAGSEPQAYVACLRRDSVINWDAVMADDDSYTDFNGSFEVDTLTASTYYTLYALLECDESSKAEVLEFEFQTSCAKVSAPWKEGFEGRSTDAMPICWDKVGNNAVTLTSTRHTGSKALYVSNSGGAAIVVLPEMEDLEGKMLRAWYRLSLDNTNYGTASFGWIENIDDASTFHELDALENVTSYAQIREVLPAGIEGRLAFRLSERTYTSNTQYLYLDDIELTECFEPTGLKVEEVSDVTAKISWTSGSAKEYKYKVLKSDVTPNWGEIVMDELSGEDEVEVGGLMANTEYRFYITTDCAASDTMSIVFRTDCKAMVASSELPWTESFEESETDAIPYCWTRIEGNNLKVSASASEVKVGSKALYMPLNSVIALPKFETPLQDLQVTFWYKNSYGSTSDLRVGELDMTDSTFTELAVIDRSSDWTKVVVSLSGASAGADRLAFNFTNGSGTAHIDSVVVEAKKACYGLRSMSIGEVGRRTIDVSVVPHYGVRTQDVWMYISPEAKTAEDLEALTAEDVVVLTDTFGHRFEKLERGTHYYIYAKAACEESWLSAETTTGVVISDKEEIVIADGTTTNCYLPLYGFWTDYEQHMQSLYPADSLTGWVGKEITAIRYYLSSSLSKTSGKWNNGTGEFTFSYAITEKSDLSEDFADDELEEIYSGTLKTDGNTLLIELSKPFTYTGGNLLIDMTHTGVSSSDLSSFFLGVSHSNGSRYKYGTNNLSVANFLPKMGGLYDLPLVLCPSVTDLSNEIEGDGAVEWRLRWTAADADYLGSYEALASKTAIEDFETLGEDVLHYDIPADVETFVLTGLSPKTSYHAYIRAICDAEDRDEGKSGWVETEFTTLADCPAVLGLKVDTLGLNKMRISWEKAKEGQAETFYYVLSESELDEAGLEAADKTLVEGATEVELSDLAYEKEYVVYVMSKCGDDISDEQHISFKTLPSCQKVENLHADRVSHNLIELSWESAEYAEETEWRVGIVGDTEHELTVSERRALLIGLEAETDYRAFVLALCGDEDKSDTTYLDFKTGAVPAGGCDTIGNGTSSGYGAICGFFGYERHGYIYTPDDGLTAGKILTLSMRVYSGSGYTIPAKIYMKHTTLSSFTSSTVPVWDVETSDAELVYEGNYQVQSDWNEITLDNGFDYTGGNLMVLFESNKTGTGGATVQYYYTAATDKHYMRRKDSNIDDSSSSSDGGSLTVNSNRINISFCKEENDNPCLGVSKLHASDITAREATISWEPGGAERAWKVYVSAERVEDMSLISESEIVDVATMSYGVSGLTPDQMNYVYVSAACEEGLNWKELGVQTLESCFAPTGVVVPDSTIEAKVARVHWVDTNLSKAGAYEVAYGEAAAFNLSDESTYAIAEASDTLVDLSGLKSDAIYKVAVRTNCGAVDGKSRWSGAVQFRTGCAVIGEAELPWSEGFETKVTNRVPTCWDVVSQDNSLNYYVYVNNTNSYRYDGDNFVLLSGYKASDSQDTERLLILPEFETEISKLQIELYYRYGNEASTAWLGVLTDADDASTFEPLFELTSATVYTHFEHNLDVASADAKRIALRFVTSSSTNILYVDDVTVRLIPDCQRPSDLAVSADGIQEDAVTIGWTAGGAETEWKLRYRKLGDEDWIELEDNVGLNEFGVARYELGGLVANTRYEAQMRSVCDAETMSDWSLSVEFKTACSTVSVLPWSEDFEDAESSVLPDCWQSSVTSVMAYDYSYYAHGGTKSLRVSQSTSRSNVVAALPEFADDVNGLMIKFWYRCNEDKYDSYWDEYDTYAKPIVGVMTDPNDISTFMGLDTLDQSSSYAYQEVMLNGAPAGAKYIAFAIFPDNYAYDAQTMYVDDIVVDYIPSCIRPSDVFASDVTNASAVISWSDNNAEPSGAYTVAYGVAAGFDLTDATTYQTVQATSTNVVLSGLTSQTTYQVAVRVDCDANDESEWSREVVTFRTTCEAVSALPWSENFDSSSSLSECWTTISEYVSTYSSDPVSLSTSEKTSGTRSLMLYNYASYLYEGKNVYAILPEFDVALNGLQLSFWYKNYYSYTYYAKLEVGVMTDKNDTTTFVLIEQLANVSDFTLAEISLSAAPSDANYIAFRMPLSTSSNYTYIDDIVLELMPTCKRVIELSAVATGTETADVSWVDRNEVKAGQYTVAYGVAAGFDLADARTFATVTSTTESVALTGLEANTRYKVAVRVDCGTGDESIYSDAIEFKTPCTAISTLPWTEDFESYAEYDLPDCWSSILNYSSNSAEVRTSMSGAYNGSKYMYMKYDYYTGSGKYVYMVLPMFDAPFTDLQLSFWYKTGYSGSDYPQPELGVMTNPEDDNTFVLLEKLSNTTTYTKVEREMSDAGISQGYIAIRMGNNSSYDHSVYVDDIEVSEIAACGVVTQITAGALSDTDVRVSWSVPSSETGATYTVAYGLAAGFNLTDAETYETVTSTTTSVVLNSLTGQTAYKAAVKKDCGSEEWSEKVEFKTVCAAISTLPWTEDFESYDVNSVPDCWDNSEGTTTNEDYKWVVKSESGKSHGGEQYMMFNSYNNYPQGNTNTLQSPVIVLTDDAQLSMYVMNPAGGDFKVQIQVDGGARTDLFTNLTNITTWEEKTADLTAYKGHSIVLYFVCVSNYGPSGAYMYLDDISITKKGSTTGIGQIEGQERHVEKVVKNQKLFIVVDGVWYDTTGRRVE